jgi:hypothetical protein
MQTLTVTGATTGRRIWKGIVAWASRCKAGIQIESEGWVVRKNRQLTPHKTEQPQLQVCLASSFNPSIHFAFRFLGTRQIKASRWMVIVILPPGEWRVEYDALVPRQTARVASVQYPAKQKRIWWFFHHVPENYWFVYCSDSFVCNCKQTSWIQQASHLLFRLQIVDQPTSSNFSWKWSFWWAGEHMVGKEQCHLQKSATYSCTPF